MMLRQPVFDETQCFSVSEASGSPSNVMGEAEPKHGQRTPMATKQTVEGTILSSAPKTARKASRGVPHEQMSQLLHERASQRAAARTAIECDTARCCMSAERVAHDQLLPRVAEVEEVLCLLNDHLKSSSAIAQTLAALPSLQDIIPEKAPTASSAPESASPTRALRQLRPFFDSVESLRGKFSLAMSAGSRVRDVELQRARRTMVAEQASEERNEFLVSLSDVNNRFQRRLSEAATLQESLRLALHGTLDVKDLSDFASSLEAKVEEIKRDEEGIQLECEQLASDATAARAMLCQKTESCRDVKEHLLSIHRDCLAGVSEPKARLSVIAEKTSQWLVLRRLAEDTFGRQMVVEAQREVQREQDAVVRLSAEYVGSEAELQESANRLRDERERLHVIILCVNTDIAAAEEMLADEQGDNVGTLEEVSGRCALLQSRIIDCEKQLETERNKLEMTAIDAEERTTIHELLSGATFDEHLLSRIQPSDDSCDAKQVVSTYHSLHKQADHLSEELIRVQEDQRSLSGFDRLERYRSLQAAVENAKRACGDKGLQREILERELRTFRDAASNVAEERDRMIQEQVLRQRTLDELHREAASLEDDQMQQDWVISQRAKLAKDYTPPVFTVNTTPEVAEKKPSSTSSRDAYLFSVKKPQNDASAFILPMDGSESGVVAPVRSRWQRVLRWPSSLWTNSTPAQRPASV